MSNYEKGSGVAWLALFIGIVSLILSWTTYNRTSDVKLEDRIRSEVETVVDRIQGEEMASSTSTTTATTTTSEE